MTWARSLSFGQLGVMSNYVNFIRPGQGLYLFWGVIRPGQGQPAFSQWQVPAWNQCLIETPHYTGTKHEKQHLRIQRQRPHCGCLAPCQSLGSSRGCRCRCKTPPLQPGIRCRGRSGGLESVAWIKSGVKETGVRIESCAWVKTGGIHSGGGIELGIGIFSPQALLMESGL